jgi:hypothetical protein
MEQILSQIVWGSSKDQDKDLIIKLCKLGEIIKWCEVDKGRQSHRNTPYQYLIDGVIVEFLPDWTFFAVKIGRNSFGFNQKDIEGVKEAVLVTKKLTNTSNFSSCSCD